MNTEELLVGAACLAIVCALLWFRRDFIFFRWRAVLTQGTITQWLTANENGKALFRPMIEFHTREGKTVTYLADERCEDKPLYPTGTQVQVRYLPGNPKQVKTIYPPQN